MAAPVEFDEQERTSARTRSAQRVVVQAALLGVLADQVLRNAPDGLGWTIWIAALAMAGVAVFRADDRRFRIEQTGWLLIAVASAAGVAWRAAEELQVAHVLGTLIALALFSMVSSGQPAASILAARIRDVVASWIFAAWDGALGALLLVFRDADIGTVVRSSAAARRPVLRAFVLTLPLFLIFTALLSRADPVFGAIFRLPSFRFEELASHIFLGGVFAWLSAGWMRGALLSTRTTAIRDLKSPLRLGLVEVTTSLGVVVALFGLFVGMQLRWLFGGADVVQATTGLSVAEYARQGFFELVGVAALVFPLILGTRACIDDDVALRRHTRLSVALLLLLAAIIASAVLRMQLYVHYFGLTTDRLYALAFMMWLAVVFLCLGLTVLRGWERPFAAVTVLSGFATLFAVTTANPEAIVARVNVNRSAVQPVDYRYLAALSADAAPTVAAAFAKAKASREVCDAATAFRQRALRHGGAGQSSHLGAAQRYNAALRTLTSSELRRLCTGVGPPVRPSGSS